MLGVFYVGSSGLGKRSWATSPPKPPEVEKGRRGGEHEEDCNNYMGSVRILSGLGKGRVRNSTLCLQ